MTKQDRVLVVGSTGTVGREVVSALIERGTAVRALLRSPGRAHPGVEAARGDLRDPDSVDRALRNVSSAVYISPHEEGEEEMAETFFRACRARGVRLVFIGVHIDGGNRLSRAVRRLVFGQMMGHYRPKFRLSERARQVPGAIVLMPTNFYQNDELVLDELLAGRFVQPLDQPINRVDVRDLGRVAARCASDPSIAPGAYPVVGPASLSGPECARIWSEALGRRVEYTGHLTRFREVLARQVSGKKFDDFSKTYEVLRSFTLPTSPDEVAVTTRLLGHAPTPYRVYVDEQADGARDTTRPNEEPPVSAVS